MAEWLKAHAWKACKEAILSWVRIPFSPPIYELQLKKNCTDFYFKDSTILVKKYLNYL